jgi:hypothetical protein
LAIFYLIDLNPGLGFGNVLTAGLLIGFGVLITCRIGGLIGVVVLITGLIGGLIGIVGSLVWSGLVVCGCPIVGF